jgi:hypothetical protein
VKDLHDLALASGEVDLGQLLHRVGFRVERANIFALSEYIRLLLDVSSDGGVPDRRTRC